MIRLRLQLPVLLLLILGAAPCLRADSGKLIVSAKGANLYAREDYEGQVIATLVPGEVLETMAQGVGAGPQAVNWYLVRTSKGLLGWVPSVDVTTNSRTDELFKDTSTVRAEKPTGLAACLATADEQARKVWAQTCERAGQGSDCPLRGFDADVLKRDHRAARDECIKVLGISKLRPAQ